MNEKKQISLHASLLDIIKLFLKIFFFGGINEQYHNGNLLSRSNSYHVKLDMTYKMMYISFKILEEIYEKVQSDTNGN